MNAQTPRQSSPIFTQTYDLLRWLVPATLNFPKSQRGVLARRLQHHAFGFYELLVDAAMSDDPAPALREADRALTKLRHYLRLSRELGLLKPGQYEHVSKIVVEIGRLLGGWLKKVRSS
jgi:hypothetical protein